MTRTAGAIVVGGGVVGASTLFQLGALGVRDALLCEAAQPGAGASGASGAFIQLHFCRNESETALTLASIVYFARWAELVGAGDPGFVPSGYLRLEPPERAAILHERVALLQGFGAGTSVITIDEVARLAPYLHTEGLATAAYEPGSGHADPEATLAGFLAAAATHGGTVLSDTTVTGLRARGGAIVGVETTAGPIDAPIVIVAAGVGTVPLLAATGVTLPIRPTLTQWLGFTLPDDVPAPAMTIGDGLSQCYFRTVAPGSREILLGIGSAAHRPWPPVPGADLLTPEEVARGAARLAQRPDHPHPGRSADHRSASRVGRPLLLRGRWRGELQDLPCDRARPRRVGDGRRAATGRCDRIRPRTLRCRRGRGGGGARMIMDGRTHGERARTIITRPITAGDLDEARALMIRTFDEDFGYGYNPAFHADCR